MKAVFFSQYGSPDILELREIEKPTPKDDEVLVRVQASSVNMAQYYAMTGLFVARMGNGLSRPKEQRLGADYAGVVEAVGKNITHFQPGDAVFGGRTGAFAEYICVRNIVIPKPANLTFEQAAAVPTAGITALQGLRYYGNIQAGQKVLINGASGGVGTFAIQIGRAFGAEVTAVCSTKNVACARSLGADHVIDYTHEDFTRRGERYDLIFDIAGSKPWSACRRVLKPDGAVVIAGGPRTRILGPLGHIIRMRLASLGSKHKVQFFIAKFTREDFLVLKDLIEAGKITPFIERTYPLNQIADAMRHLGEGHAQGKIVVSMA